MKKKSIALLCSCSLLAGIAVSSTMAWLTSTSDRVVNTFTVGDINIVLKEHDYDPAKASLLTPDDYTKNLVDENEDYKFVPGDTLPKDPFVTVKAGSEDCWLFVHIKELNNTIGADPDKKIVNYAIDSSVWTEVPGYPGYYYYNAAGTNATVETTESESSDPLHILKDNKVTISTEVTKEMVTEINDDTKPQLIFTAAAIQKKHVGDEENMSVEDGVMAAWNNLPNTFTNTGTSE